MVDVERVIRLLDAIRQDVERLRSASPVSSEALDGVKYRFITAIEGAARVAHHLSVSEGWTTPETNAAAFAVLAEHEVISADIAHNLARAAGFRNILVHRYTEVDDQQVVAQLSRLSDFDEYVAQVGTWLEMTG